MLVKQPDAKQGTVRVTFQFPCAIWAEQVHLVGDFNRWDRSSLPLSRSRKDSEYWEVTLALEEGREYQFRYLIDKDTWYNDPKADGYVSNPYGQSNSIVRT